MSESLKDSLFRSYRWGIAGLIGAMISQLEFPGLGPILEYPFQGALIIGMMTLLFILLVLVGTVWDQVISTVAGSESHDPVKRVIDQEWAE